QVAGDQRHLVAEGLGQLGQKVEGLVLRGAQLGDTGQALRRLDERPRVMAGEDPPPSAPRGSGPSSGAALSWGTPGRRCAASTNVREYWLVKRPSRMPQTGSA